MSEIKNQACFGLTVILISGISVVVALLIYLAARSSVTVCKGSPPIRQASSLESAISNFYTEYGIIPATTSEVKTDTPEGIHLLNVLLGLEKSAHPQNVRLVKFLNISEAKDKKNGLIYSTSGDSVEGLYDLWGNPFTIQMDTDNDEILRFKIGGKPIELKGRRAAAYSPGKDHQFGTKDDLLTWG